MHDHAFLEALAATAKRRRQDLGLQQAELAELARCSTRFVHAVEAGKPTLRLDKVCDLLAAMGLGLRVVLAADVGADERLRGAP